MALSQTASQLLESYEEACIDTQDEALEQVVNDRIFEEKTLRGLLDHIAQLQEYAEATRRNLAAANELERWLYDNEIPWAEPVLAAS